MFLRTAFELLVSSKHHNMDGLVGKASSRSCVWILRECIHWSKQIISILGYRYSYLDAFWFVITGMFCGVLQPHLFWTTRVLIALFPAASALSHEDPTQAEPREAASPRPCRCTARARMSHGNSSSCLFPPPLTSPSTPSRSVCFCCWFSRRDQPSSVSLTRYLPEASVFAAFSFCQILLGLKTGNLFCKWQTY